MDLSVNLFSVGQATLFTAPDSLEGQRLRLFVLEKGCPCALRYATPELMDEQLLSVNPDRHLPFLADRMLSLWSVDAIEQYIEERFPHPTFMPADPQLRAQIRQLSDSFREWYEIEHERFAGPALAQLEQLLSKTAWLCGMQRTMADIALYPFIHRWRANLPPVTKTYYARWNKLTRAQDSIFSPPPTITEEACDGQV